MVEAAKTNYRLTLDFALKAVKAVKLPVEAITIVDGPRQFVKYLGTKEAPQYVFDADNLVAAPAHGHRWARNSGPPPARARRRID